MRKICAEASNLGGRAGSPHIMILLTMVLLALTLSLSLMLSVPVPLTLSLMHLAGIHTYALVARYPCCMSIVMHTMLLFRVRSYASTPPIRHFVCTHPNSMLPATHCDFLLEARRRFRNRKCRHVPADERHPEERPAAKRPAADRCCSNLPSLQPCQHRTASAYRMHPNSLLPATLCDFQLKARRRFRNRKCRHVSAGISYAPQYNAARDALRLSTQSSASISESEVSSCPC